MRHSLRFVLVMLAGTACLGVQTASGQEDVVTRDGTTAQGQPFQVTPSGGRPFPVGRVIVSSGLADFDIFESTLPAGSPATPLHRHDVYDEGFLVLDGEIDFVAGNQTLRCGPGCFAFVPRGVPHAFTNVGRGEARMWVIGSSGVQAMVEEVAPMLSGNAPNIDEVIAAFARHKSALVVTPASPSSR